MIATAIQLAISTGLIIVVANYLLYQPAKRISERLAFSPNKAGQMLGYLTSAPELVASIAVASTGLMAAVAYNILSSNIINVILAAAAATWYRQARTLFTRDMWREHTIIVATIAIPVLLLVTGQVEAPWVIPAFLVTYVGYLVVLRTINNTPHLGDNPTPNGHTNRTHHLRNGRYVTMQAGIIVAALIALYFLGSILGSTVHTLGTTFGVPAFILGAAIGVATSLPELTTFFSSYSWHQRHNTQQGSHEVTHNLLASNVSNLLIVQTVGLAVFLLIAT